tara:strand:+ start:673 stop:849 length:177 start_codon:yes stop_codon:yes gene_type:complete
MKYLEDDEYGVLYLAPLINGWYIGLEEELPYYYKLDKNKKKVEIATRDIPQEILDKFT